MKFESKYDIGQLVQFSPKEHDTTNFEEEKTSITETKVGTIKMAKFTDNVKPTYDISVMNTKDTDNNVPEDNILKAFRPTT